MIPRTPIARKPRAPVKKVNPKRKAREFARAYGSKRRVEFIRGLPCSACGVVGYSENAHVLGNGGLSRKAAYDTIAPLCAPRSFVTASSRGWLLGCHKYYDVHRTAFLNSHPRFNPEEAARETEELWASSVLEDGK